MHSRNCFYPKHTDNRMECLLNSAICTKVGFTYLWGFEIHVLAKTPEILYWGYHQGNILRFFLEMRGGKYLPKRADIVSCCSDTSLVFPLTSRESVCSLASCNLRPCVTSQLVNRWWQCLCLCTAFQSCHYIMYQPLKLWFEIPLTHQSSASSVHVTRVCLRRRFPTVSTVSLTARFHTGH